MGVEEGEGGVGGGGRAWGRKRVGGGEDGSHTPLSVVLLQPLGGGGSPTSVWSCYSHLPGPLSYKSPHSTPPYPTPNGHHPYGQHPPIGVVAPNTLHTA